MKKILLLPIFFIALLFISCASGSAIVTGEVRHVIDVAQVKVYSEYPLNYEVIAIVTASSDAGWTAQDDYNYAVEELKKQAAKVGANGVVVESLSESNSATVISNGFGGFYALPISEHSVTGKAIFVEE